MAPISIGVEKIGHRIVRDEQVHAAVVVDVRGHYAPGLAWIRGDAAFLTYVGEGAVAIVVKKPAGHGRKNFRITIFRHTHNSRNVRGEAIVVFGFIEIAEPANE